MVVTRKGPTGRYIIVSFTETECGERKGLTHREKNREITGKLEGESEIKSREIRFDHSS